jgi:hypothetical protein
MKKSSRFVSTCALPIFLLAGGAANAANLIPTRTFNTVDWVSTGGFQVCSGNTGDLPCVNGTGQLAFSNVEATVTRSFTVTPPLDNVSFFANGQGYFSADPGTVYLRAFDAMDQLLEETFVTNSFPNGSSLPVSLVLQNATALATATRIEVEVTGSDNNVWAGNYGTVFFGLQLFTNDMDKDGLEDNVDPLPDDDSYLGSIKTDKTGSSVAFAGDFNGDGYGDYVIGIPGYDLPATLTTKIQKDAGRAVVISGKNGDELASIAGFAAKSAMGFAVAGNGDINNDGFSDVIVGAPHVFKDSGSVTVLYGPDGGTPFSFFGPQEKALMGSALAMTDWNNDNHADLVVGIPKANESLNSIPSAGCVVIFSGDGIAPLLGADFCGDKPKAYFGTSVAVGDVNNDGDPDLVVGAPNDDDVVNNRKDTGSVIVYLNSGTPLEPKYGTVAKAYLGKSVASGDVNNDGYADVLAGAPGDDDSEDALKDTGSVAVFSGFDGSLLAKQYETTAKAGLGNSVAAGDVNNDGFADIIAGASIDDMPSMPKIIKDTGSVSVWSGSDYAPITTWYGDVSKDAFGSSVSAGDVNGDGKADVIIGIPGFDIPPVPPAKTIKDAGAVKVQSGASL